MFVGADTQSTTAERRRSSQERRWGKHFHFRTGWGPDPIAYPQPWPDPGVAVAYDSRGSGLAAAGRWDGTYLSGDNGNQWVGKQGVRSPIAFTDVSWTNGSISAAAFGARVVPPPVKIQTQGSAM